MRNGKSCLLIGGMIAVILSSCSTNTDVVHDGWIQKRKHRQGFHIELGSRKADKHVAHQKRHRKTTPESAPSISEFDAARGHGSDLPLEHSSADETQKRPLIRTAGTRVKNKIQGMFKEAKHPIPMFRNMNPEEAASDMDPRQAGILSIVFACLPIVISIPLLNIVSAIVAIRMANIALASDDPSIQTLGQVGKIIGLIALVYSIVITLFWILYIGFIILILGLGF